MLATQAALAAGAPEDVKGLAATAIDEKSIGLTWDATKDATGGPVDHYRIYYGKTSVFKEGEGNYDKEINTSNSNTSYVINKLDPETEYFFSITAFDSDNTESEQYAQEVSATTMAAEDSKRSTEESKSSNEPIDTEAPKVTSVSAPNNQTVEIQFNEVINLKIDDLINSFVIVEQQDSNKKLTINGVQLSEADNKSIAVLTTDIQTENKNYIVTVNENISDIAGNKIVKGGSDSGLFLGSALAKSNQSLTEATEVDCKDDYNCFAKKLVDCTVGTYTQSDDEFSYSLEITGSSEDQCVIKYTANKHPNVLFANSTMDCNIPSGNYKTAEDYQKTFNLSSCNGDLVSGYKAVEIKDVTPPEDITNLLVSFTKVLEKYMVSLNWTASLNTAQDLVDQMLYMSLDRGANYDAGKSLGANATSTKVNDLNGGTEYTFKITTKDDAGNESAGAIKSIRLPQTGLGAGLLLFGSALAAKEGLRRRKRK